MKGTVRNDSKTDLSKAARRSKVVMVITALLALVGCSSTLPSNTHLEHQTDGAIIGGVEATGLEQFSRSIAFLYNKKGQTACTSSIITNAILLTAAHCIEGVEPKDLVVAFGLDIINSEPGTIQARPVDDFAASPYYTLGRYRTHNTGDIALVHFVGGLPEGYEKASLLGDLSYLKNFQKVILAGYGVSDGAKKTGTGKLRYVETMIADTAYTVSEVKVDQSLGKGACFGDSGGPAYLSINGSLLVWGVTSRGVDDVNGDCSVASAYTSIPFYISWIVETVATLNSSYEQRLAESQPPTAPEQISDGQPMPGQATEGETSTKQNTMSAEDLNILWAS